MSETQNIGDGAGSQAPTHREVDVVILGGGLAGLSLARQLLLETNQTVLLIDKREIPPRHQKVGESTVQVGGYYFSKVLDMEEHLFTSHLMKYNLRFYWKSSQRENKGFEDFSQAYIRPFSNIASYQLDRNEFEAELIRRNEADPRCTLVAPATGIDVEMGTQGGNHVVQYEDSGKAVTVQARWVVDTSGRWKFLRKQRDLQRPTAIRHSAAFCWVDGLVDIEKLTTRSRQEVRVDRRRKTIGHIPLWLATNHFMGEGFWFWVIPLQGKTSLGLVFDQRVIPFESVCNRDKLMRWISEEFPLFAPDLKEREILDFGGYKEVSHGCAQTISEERWALSGESGRFLDPLYSPGSDFIAIYNTLIVDAIRTDDAGELAGKCRLYEQVMRALFEAYIPGFSTSYNALGDAETFVIKYGWELAVYFAFYVFPFINDLYTDRRFLISYLNRFGKLGPLNQNLQEVLAAYFNWKQERRIETPEPVDFDFFDLGPLKRTEETFYQVGVSVEEARKVLDQQLEHLEELARFFLAHVASVVLNEPRALTQRSFVAAIDPTDFPFDPEKMRRLFDAAQDGEDYTWNLDAAVLEPFAKVSRQGAVSQTTPVTSKETAPEETTSKEAASKETTAAR